MLWWDLKRAVYKPTLQTSITYKEEWAKIIHTGVGNWKRHTEIDYLKLLQLEVVLQAVESSDHFC